MERELKKRLGTVVPSGVLGIVPKRVLGRVLSAVLVTALTVALALACRTEVRASGQAEDSAEVDWQSIAQSLPDESLELLPDGALEDADSFGAALEEMSGFEYVARQIVSVAGIELEGALRLAAAITAILMLSAVFSSVSASLDNRALSLAVRFCSSSALFATLIAAGGSQLGRIERFFDAVSELMGAMIPVTASVWAMGGNVSTAAVGSSSFYVMLTVCNGIFAKSILPVAAIMSVLALSEAASEDMRTGRLLQAIKRIYSLILTLVMTLLLSSMAAQTSIAASSDGAVARSARLVSGSAIPVLGGSVGETLRTVAGGVGYLKSVIGVGGTVLIFLLLLPVGISVLLYRLVLLLTGGLADLLGCAAEARLLESLGEVYGCILAVISGVSVTFVLAFCIFTQTVVAVA